jgi:hypothetical protein
MRTKLMPAFCETAENLTVGSKTLPQKYFVSPEIFAEEQATIFQGNGC